MPYARAAIRAYLAERTDGNPALFVAHGRNAAGSRSPRPGRTTSSSGR
jgi:hypothetical protein